MVYFFGEQQKKFSFMNFPPGVLNSSIFSYWWTLSADTGRIWKDMMTFTLDFLGESYKKKNPLSSITWIYCRDQLCDS